MDALKPFYLQLSLSDSEHIRVEDSDSLFWLCLALLSFIFFIVSYSFRHSQTILCPNLCSFVNFLGPYMCFCPTYWLHSLLFGYAHTFTIHHSPFTIHCFCYQHCILLPAQFRSMHVKFELWWSISLTHNLT